MTLTTIGLNSDSWTFDEISDEVPLALEIQRRLKAWGYDVGTPDGDWGPKSRRAYSTFAKAYKFDEDELSPAAARQLLQHAPSEAKPPTPAPRAVTPPTPVTPRPTPTPVTPAPVTPAPKPVMPRVLRDIGSQLTTWPIAAVIDNVPLALEMQRRLQVWKYNVGTPDGDWGPNSQRAYAEFARANGFKDTELSPAAARQLLTNPTPPKPEPRPVAPTTLLALSNQSATWPIASLRTSATFIRELQQRLTVWGQAPGAADGAWGPKSQAAYSAFATANKFNINEISPLAAKQLLQAPPRPEPRPEPKVEPKVEPKPNPVVIQPGVPLPANLRLIYRGTTSYPIEPVTRTLALAKEIQLSLDAIGYGLGSASGQWGPRSQGAFDRFCRAYSLDAKVMTPRMAKLLLEPEIPGIPVIFPAPARLAMADYQAVAASIKCEVAAVRAVVSVEAAGSGFYSDGRPKILFEAHWFSDLTDGDYDDSQPSISSPVWNRDLYIGGVGEWDRLYLACTIDRAAAMKSASWGLGQVMGFNHRAAGYADVEAFVRDMHLSEGKQLMAMFNFIKTNGLDRALIRKDWAAFARGYNGESYRANAYDEKLADAYESWS